VGWEAGFLTIFPATNLMKRVDNQSGFTLLELIVSLAIIALIASLSMGGVRLGISAREIGEERADIYQRLRFIGEQISQKIKSTNPLFIKPPDTLDNIFIEEQTLENDQSLQKDSTINKDKKIIAFEGRSDSIHLVTFVHGLSNFKKTPWIHEVSIYKGQNPITEEDGIIMMEKDIFAEDIFSEINSNSDAVNYITLAKDVAFLKFRYYKMEIYTPEELEQLEDKSKEFYGEWVDEVVPNPTEDLIETFGIDEEDAAFKAANKISLPRALEISFGLEFPEIPGKIKDDKVYYLPPTIISFNSGVLLSRPSVEEEENEIL
jgi:prepilin-type N-terminal cleavage/methylation domain-containing protein